MLCRTPDEMKYIHNQEVNNKKREGIRFTEICQSTDNSAENTPLEFIVIFIAENNAEVVNYKADKKEINEFNQ
jgi:hypothetical protein